MLLWQEQIRKKKKEENEKKNVSVCLQCDK